MDSQDMIFEILTRITSLPTLERCRGVSKYWKQLTYDPDFMPTLCNRTNCVSGYIFQTFVRFKCLSTFVSIDQSSPGRNHCNIKIDSKDGQMRLLATSNLGICCYERTTSDRRKHRYFACKPATQQWEPMPNPKLKYRTVSVGIVVIRSAPLRYKIVRLSDMAYGRRRRDVQYDCEIFDSETWGRWRRIHGVNLTSCPDYDFIHERKPPVCIGGSLHWLTQKDNVLKFNATKECFNEFSLPQQVDQTCICKTLFEYQGKLGVSCIFRDLKTIKFWFLRGCGDEWIRGGKEIDITSLGNHLDYVYFFGYYNTQLLFVKTFGAFFYRLNQQSVLTYKVDLDFDFLYGLYQVFQFRSDLEMVELRGRRHKLL